MTRMLLYGASADGDSFWTLVICVLEQALRASARPTRISFLVTVLFQPNNVKAVHGRTSIVVVKQVNMDVQSQATRITPFKSCQASFKIFGLDPGVYPQEPPCRALERHVVLEDDDFRVVYVVVNEGERRHGPAAEQADAGDAPAKGGSLVVDIGRQRRFHRQRQ